MRNIESEYSNPNTTDNMEMENLITKNTSKQVILLT